MNINDILDTEVLERHIRDGFIAARRHPHLPLTVLNYTAKAQYERMWDGVTMRCRGLVVDNRGKIVANCMPKFFNYGEPAAENIKLDGPVEVTDKLDGSMGEIAFYQGELIVATRGSFESDQAKFAYNHIVNNPEYYHSFKVLCGDSVTAIVEIIYPENRIVLDYGEVRDVVLIGAIANNQLSNGRQLWIPADQIYSWPGPKVEKFSANTFEDALRIPPRTNKEGVVVYFKKTGDRLKIKQEDYIIAHRFISNLTPKNIWEQLYSGKTVEDMLEIAPDEFHDLVREIAGSLIKSYADLLRATSVEYLNIELKLPTGYTRKDFALAAATSPYRAHLFHILDNRKDALIESVWKAIQP
jgi:RNA ligase